MSVPLGCRRAQRRVRAYRDCGTPLPNFDRTSGNRLGKHSLTNANGKAETVIKNADIITMDTSRTEAQALAMAHGRFAGIASSGDFEGLVGRAPRYWTW